MNVGDYLEEIWSAMAKPEWMATTGVPLVVTLAGFLAAFLLVRLQLRSDRLLRTADRNQVAAGRLGVALGDAVRRLSETPADERWWGHHEWSDHLSLERELDEALIYLPEADLPEVRSTIRDIAAAWRACIVGAVQSPSVPDKAEHREGMRRVIDPYSKELLKVALELRSWDGRAMTPSTPSPLVHCPSDPREWMRERRGAYDDYVNNRTGLTLVKPLGRRLWSE